MAGTKHTQGPWQFHGRARGGGSTKARFIIAGTTSGQPDVSGALVGELEVSEADARLIAAAPELLIQLKGMLGLAEFLINAVDVDTGRTKVVLRKDGEAIAEVPISVILMHTKAAIAKAEGR